MRNRHLFQDFQESQNQLTHQLSLVSVYLVQISSGFLQLRVVHSAWTHCSFEIEIHRLDTVTVFCKAFRKYSDLRGIDRRSLICFQCVEDTIQELNRSRIEFYHTIRLHPQYGQFSLMDCFFIPLCLEIASRLSCSVCTRCKCPCGQKVFEFFHLQVIKAPHPSPHSKVLGAY